MPKLITIFASLALWLASSAWAQEVSTAVEDTAGPAAPESSQSAPPEDTGTMDEVRVVGSKSIRDLQRELIAAEDDIYSIFNALNDDDDYDIICAEETRVKSQFRRRVCKARLYREAVAESAEDYKDGEELFQAKLDHEHHGKVLSEKMRNLAAGHPQLLAALKKHRDLQQAYQAAQREREKP